MDLSSVLIMEHAPASQDSTLTPPKHLLVSLAQLSTVMSALPQTQLSVLLARLELLLTLSVKHVLAELVSISMEQLAVNAPLNARTVVLLLLLVLHVSMLLVET